MASQNMDDHVLNTSKQGNGKIVGKLGWCATAKNESHVWSIMNMRIAILKKGNYKY